MLKMKYLRYRYVYVIIYFINYSLIIYYYLQIQYNLKFDKIVRLISSSYQELDNDQFNDIILSGILYVDELECKYPFVPKYLKKEQGSMWNKFNNHIILDEISKI